ncbi:MAG TPA: sorbosone dehydrogenase family protein [Chitinophagaceae bacterium]|jgi:glucose/arabinose dehydrogenase|nr:sorbosone dehydrogenase family protein [Chitinophagaceae bacterium]
MKAILFSAIAVIVIACKGKQKSETAEAPPMPADTATAETQELNLPPPYATKSVRNMSEIIAWPSGKKPIAPEGFVVSKFADSLDHPRWVYQASNGDVFIAELNSPHNTLEKITGKNKSADQITLLRDADKDGVPELRTAFLKDLNKPFGMLIIGNNFYVANTDGLVKFPYKPGSTFITEKGKQIISYPGGPRHWTRNIIANADGSKIYISIGSSSDHAEDGIDKEQRRAMILEINPDGSGEKVYASGLRNPVGMDWAPGTQILWTAVNERDELGDDLVPDYLTSVKEGGFYGWPYSYWGKHKDPRVKEEKPDLVDKAIIPDVPLDNHSAPLGLAFYTKTSFPAKYRDGAFIGQHGSWNKSTLAGYKVVFVPFKNGKPSGRPEDFLTGFIADKSSNKVYGRPVGVTVLQDGSLLVADDGSNIIWRVAAKG